MPTPNDRGPHRPRTNIQYHVENGWVVPDQPQPPPRTAQAGAECRADRAAERGRTERAGTRYYAGKPGSR